MVILESTNDFLSSTELLEKNVGRQEYKSVL